MLSSFGCEAKKKLVTIEIELQDGLPLPTNKTELVEYLGKGDVIPFHKYVCSSCHLVPKYEEWKTLPVHGKLKKE